MNTKECLLLDNFEPQKYPHIYVNKTLSFQPMYVMPNIFLNISGLEYVCGPLVMILKELSIKHNIL